MSSRVRIIVVAYNSERDISECLNSLSCMLGNGVEVVVIDNSSNDRTADIIMEGFPEVRFIRSPSNVGYAGGNNLGLYEPLPDHIVFLNPDTWSDGDWLSPLLVDLDRYSDAGIAQPKILLHHSRQHLNSRGNEANFLLFGWPEGYGQVESPEDECRRISFPSGCAFAIKRDALRTVGGFDTEYFMYGEDLDLGIRSFLNGWDAIYSPSSALFHKYHYRESPRKYFYLERNRMMTLLKVYKKRTLLLILPILLVTETVIILRAFSEGWLVEKMQSYLSILENGYHVASQRSKLQSSRRRSDKNLLELLRGGLNFAPIDTSKFVRLGNRLMEKYRLFLMNMRLMD